MITTTEMRISYLLTERSCHLQIDGPGLYSIIRAFDGAVLIGPYASLKAAEGYCVSIDPYIVGVSSRAT